MTTNGYGRWSLENLFKVKNNKMIFLMCQRVWKTVKSQGKIRKKSRNLEVDDKWPPCMFPKGVSELKRVNVL